MAGSNPPTDRDRRELEVLHRLALSTARSLEFSEVVAALALELTMGIDRCDETTISVWDRGRDELEVAAGHTRAEGPDLDSVGETYPLSETPDLRALLHHTDGHVAYRPSDPCWSDEARRILAGWGWRTWLAVPLVVEGRSVGLIEVADTRSSRTWSRRDIAFCRTVAAQAALALRNAQLYDDLRQRVDRDPLTNVLNHRAFYERLGSELARFGRAARPLTVMVADLDDFKGVNDRRGHLAGDRALCQTARALEAASRTSDVVGRLGGDEFALILPEMVIGDADTVGGRIQRLLAAAGLSGSLGFAAAREGDTDPRALVLRADRSLLDAKAAGKGTHRIAA